MSLPRLPFLYPSFIHKRFLLPFTVSPGPILRTPSRFPEGSLVLPRYRHGTAVEPVLIPEDPPKDIKTNKEPTDKGKAKDGPIPAAVASGETGGSYSIRPADESATTSLEGGKANESGAPPLSHHLTPAPFVHHFDTFDLFNGLVGSGFAKGQAVTIMKGVRGLLENNLEVARENFVSKSNVENESYLFYAACSELRNEIQNDRKTQMDQLRMEGASIQQEFDLLNQKFLEDIMSLKDELNGLFNDRKMVTRAEQRSMENKIQELNYKITILINSDLKSEIEKLRWTTTRRGLIAIATLAIFVVASIKFSKSEHDEKAKRDKETGAADGSAAEFHQGLLTEKVAHGHPVESSESPALGSAGANPG